jgi:hypothetical protein
VAAGDASIPPVGEPALRVTRGAFGRRRDPLASHPGRDESGGDRSGEIESSAARSDEAAGATGSNSAATSGPIGKQHA